MNTNLVRAQVGSVFMLAHDRISASGNHILRRAAASGHVAQDNFKKDMSDVSPEAGMQVLSKAVNIGHIIVRCATMPVDERIKMRI